MARYINTTKYFNQLSKNLGISRESLIDLLAHIPSADVVEVVRCKDCKCNVANMNIDPLDETDYSGEDIVCTYFSTDGMLPNDYCSYGERIDT